MMSGSVGVISGTLLRAYFMVQRIAFFKTCREPNGSLRCVSYMLINAVYTAGVMDRKHSFGALLFVAHFD